MTSLNLGYAHLIRKATISSRDITGKDRCLKNMTQIVSPDYRVFLIARVLVKNESDLPFVYNLSKQMQLTPLNN